MYKKRKFVITTDDGISFAQGTIDEDETLKAFGLELDEDQPQLDADDIKYELIEYIRGKPSDAIIFNKYRLLNDRVECQTYIRIKFGSEFIDFIIFDPKMSQRFLNALKRAQNRLIKTERQNRYCPNRDKLARFFSTINGSTLTELLRKSRVDQIENEKRSPE